MTVTHEQVEQIIALLRKRYPDWKGFDHSEFQHEEIDYKQATIEKASHLLGKEEFQRLLDSGATDDIIQHLEIVGRATNLLYQSVPLQGDLNVLYQPNLDKPAFCTQLNNT